MLNSSIDSQTFPIIYLVSTPRSVSTAFLKMMYYRGDFKTLHEPSASIFLKKQYPNLNGQRLSAYSSAKQAPNELAEFQKQSPVFVKDVIDHFLSIYDECKHTLVNNLNLHFVMLVRDPADILLSLHKGLGIDEHFQEFFPELESLSNRVGLKNLYQIMEESASLFSNNPKVIFANELAENPKKIIELFCKKYQIPFSEDFLTWESGESEFLDFPLGEDGRYPRWVTNFFSNVIHSTSFKKIKGCLRNDMEEPTFAEVENLKIRQFLQEAYQENVIYYNKFLEAKQFHIDSR